jgi:EAL domain-containing protein (putative c-di-GMP-specific phosphodiesterase class I)
MKTGAFAGAEALVRWQHPERGLLPPDEFIPLAEQNGLIRHLSHWVLERALQQCRAWRQLGLALPVSVNLSMRDLHDRHLPDAVANILARWNVEPDYLTLEITESTLMADPARAMEVVARLSAMGIQIAIDDFGTGYSSLAYLKRLPVDKLKIDKSFVRHLATDVHDAAIVESTVGLAHALGLSLVAEGVEDQASWDLLARMGCDVAQGYFISRPIPPDTLTAWLKALPLAA